MYNMHKPFLTFLFIILFAGIAHLQATEIPISTRSQEAINRVKHPLKRALNIKGFNLGDPLFIRVFKEPKKLEVWVKKGDQFKLFKTYKICYFSGDLGPKFKEGDMQSPEGFYYVTPDKLNPQSAYHLSFDLGFPNKYDRANGRAGSYLMVHGRCVSIGCYAMTDKRIEEIYTLMDAAFRGGQPFVRVHIFPFEMDWKNMGRYLWSPWYSFWSNLKEGYDYFENKKLPPDVNVKNKRYVFE